MAKVARVALVSPLPQLDRFFDYSIPSALLHKVLVGNRVSVPFGRAKKPIDGFVMEVIDHSDFSGQLAEILDVSDPNQPLSEQIAALVKELSKRNVATLGEFLKLAIPSPMPKVHIPIFGHRDLKSIPVPAVSRFAYSMSVEEIAESNRRVTLILDPKPSTIEIEEREVFRPSWIPLFLGVAIENLRSGRSTLLITPNFRDHAMVIAAAKSFGIFPWCIDYSQNQSKSKRLIAFMHSRSQPAIVIGNRNAIFAPAENLGSILILDEADESYTDEAAPYLNAREVALVRQQLEQCSLVFAAFSRSTEVERLIGIGYFEDISANFVRPAISTSESSWRVDSQAYRAISEGILAGPVLVQVAGKGESMWLRCSNCRRQARCKNCSGPLWRNERGSLRCRWCNAYLDDFSCECGNTELNSGLAGATKTAKEMGKMFPNTRIIEIDASSRLVEIDAEPAIVVATAGAEPFAKNGYSAVVILDGEFQLSRQSLRAKETVVRNWSNAVAKLSSTGRAVVVGLQGEFAKEFSLWDQKRIASKELADRNALGLPPATKFASAVSSQHELNKLRNQLEGLTGISFIGPAPLDTQEFDWRLYISYPYSEVYELVARVKAFQLNMSISARRSKSGRAARALKFKVNDSEQL